MCLAVPGKIISLNATQSDIPFDYARAGRVDFGGIVREINLAFVPEAEVGDYVVVHVGVALSRLDQAEAVRVFEYLDQIGELLDLEPAGEHP